MATTFKLRFPPFEIPALAAQYGYADETEALEAGGRIAAGDCSVTNLMTIVAWKSARPTSRVRTNSEADIADALRLAVEAKTERAAVAVLIGLRGVQVPVASAILTAIDPARFTIIDYRALAALDVEQLSPTVEFYLEYLVYCQRLAREVGVSLRVLDRALWQWSKNQ